MAQPQGSGGLRGQLVEAAVRVGSALRRVRVRGIPRLMWWTAPYVIGRGQRVVPSVNDVNICIDTREYIACMMVYGRFAPEVVALLRDLLEPGDSVIDIGAHLGYISSIMARLVGPRGKVHSFEPDPNALRRLRRTIAANDFDWIEVFPVALSDGGGELTFHVSPTLGWSTAVAGSHYDDLQQVVVPCRRIDDMLQAGELRRPIKLIKMDVEGYEYAVLDGMQRLLADERPYLVMENAPILLEPNKLTSVDVLGRIVKHGYRVYRLHEPRGLLAGDRYSLTRIDPHEVQDFCDLVCVPQERDPS